MGDIQTVDYSWGEINFEVSEVSYMRKPSLYGSLPDEGFDMDIEPDDIDVSDTVTIVWEIQ